MYKKLTTKTGTRMTPHRFRHTIASELMRQPERNIHITKNLLNHSNIATTMEYIEPDYDLMREVMNERGQRHAKINYLIRPVLTKHPDAPDRTASTVSIVAGTASPPTITCRCQIEKAEAAEPHERERQTLEKIPTPPETKHSEPLPAQRCKRTGDAGQARAKPTDPDLAEDHPALEYDLSELEDIAQWVRENAAGEMAVQGMGNAVTTDSLCELQQAVSLPFSAPWTSRSAR